jgi:hypothetical protein
MQTYKGRITQLEPNEVFVFGSNPQGRHGKGAALIAKLKFGAKYGQARGLMGQSYGIVTKDLTKQIHPSVSTKDIKKEIAELYNFATLNPTMLFYVAYSGKGKLLSGFTPQQMANLFAKASDTIPNNIVFEEEFAKLLII